MKQMGNSDHQAPRRKNSWTTLLVRLTVTEIGVEWKDAGESLALPFSHAGLDRLHQQLAPSYVLATKTLFLIYVRGV